jgi:hypothetical protein
MKLFKYENFQLSLNEPEILLVKEFKTLFDSDKSKGKTKSFNYLTYIYLMLDWSSPYIDYTDDLKKERALLDSGLKEDSLKDPLFQDVYSKYDEIINSNRILRYAKSQWKLLDKIEEYVESVDLTEIVESGPQKGKLVHSVRDARDTVKQMPELIEKAKEVRKQVQEELKESTGARGNQEQPLERY